MKVFYSRAMFFISRLVLGFGQNQLAGFLPQGVQWGVMLKSRDLPVFRVIAFRRLNTSFGSNFELHP